MAEVLRIYVFFIYDTHLKKMINTVTKLISQLCIYAFEEPKHILNIVLYFLLFSNVDVSCIPQAIGHVCATEGSSPVLTFTINSHVYHTRFTKKSHVVQQSRIFSNFTLQVDLYIYNVTPAHEGNYTCGVFNLIEIRLASK